MIFIDIFLLVVERNVSFHLVLVALHVFPQFYLKFCITFFFFELVEDGHH